MAAARGNGDAEHAVSWSAVFKAMGDPTRLKILLTLVREEHNVTQLSKALKLDAPTVSFHLTRLRYSGLVVNERRGQQVFYHLNPRILKKAGDTKVLDFEGLGITFKK